MRGGVWFVTVAMVGALSACSGEVLFDGDPATGDAGSGGAPADAAGGAAAGGQGTPSGGAATSDGGQTTGGQAAGGQSAGGQATGGELGMGGAGDGACTRTCDGELEECVAGACVATDAVRALTTQVHVPGGTFVMGRDDFTSSSPPHEQTLQDFWLDQTEVTAAAYDRCVLAGACTSTESGVGANSGAPGFESYPINYVTHHQAEAFCAWMGGRLPTEAEWEYAAGGRQGLEYPWGDSTPHSCMPATVSPNPPETDYDHGCAVGQFPANQNGLFDMGGGFYEFTSSPYCVYSDATDTGYVPGCRSDSFALRDGAFTSISTELAQVSSRQPVLPDVTHQSMGFRCALSVTD